MNKLLETYIDPQYVYKFTQGPDVVRSREDALRDGINCISLAHLALRDLFDYELPAELFCLELYYDREHFTEVGGLENMQAGDLVWLGLASPTVEIEDFVPRYKNGRLTNWSESPVKHAAIFTGEKDQSSDHLLLHSTPYEGTNAVWPLKMFSRHKRYRKVYGITRLQISSDT